MRHWAVRICEGLVVGLAAGVCIFLIQELREATKKLDNATSYLGEQVEVNKATLGSISTVRRDFEVLKTLTQEQHRRINNALDELAGKLEQIAKVKSATASGFDLSSLKLNKKNQIKIPVVPWVIPKKYTDPNDFGLPKDFDWSKYNIDITKLPKQPGSRQPFQLEGQAHKSLTDFGALLEKQAKILE